MTLVWSIIGCGPSLDWSAIEPPGVVVVVNRAIQGATRADYWCCIDKPNAEHGVCVEDARRLRPVVVTQGSKRKVWAKWQGLELRTLAEPDHAGSWVQAVRQGGHRYSMISAIALAVSQGAQEIQFYGVDMAGRGYHTGEPVRLRDKSAWEERWKPDQLRKELVQIRRVYQAGTQRGIRMVGFPAHVTDGLRPAAASDEVRASHADGVGPGGVAGALEVSELRPVLLGGSGRADALGPAVRAGAEGEHDARQARGAEARGALSQQGDRKMNEEGARAAAEVLLRQVTEMEVMIARLQKFANTQRTLAAEIVAAFEPKAEAV